MADTFIPLVAAYSGSTPSGIKELGTSESLALKGYTETVYSATGSSFTIDLTNGSIQKLTTNGNTSITLPSSVSGKSYMLIIAYGGTHTVSFSSGSTIKWAGGTAPTATSVNGKFDIYVFTCDGTNIYANDGGRAYNS